MGEQSVPRSAAMWSMGGRTLRVLLSVAGLLGSSVAAAGGEDKKASARVEDEVVVLLREGAQIAPLLVKHQLTLAGRFGSRPIYRLKTIGRASVDSKIKALRYEPEVRFAEPNVVHEVPEPRKNVPWAIGDPRSEPGTGAWAAEAINLAQAHRLSDGQGVRVAVLDGGVDARHPTLAGRLLPGWDFVDWDPDPSEEGAGSSRTYGHGTHVAGLVAMVAPGARIIPLRILDRSGVGNAWVLAEAMLYAVDPDGDPSTNDGAHVINLSVSSLTKTELFKTVAKMVSCKTLKELAKKAADDEDGKGADDGDESPADAVSYDDKVRCAGFGGALVVAAAGNRGTDRSHEYPAAESSSSLISVGSSERSGRLAAFSNYGWVKLAAPGAEVSSAVPGGGYATWSGTSMAAPLVSGAAALLRSLRRDLPAEDVAKRLLKTGRKLCDTSMPQLDVAAALVGKAAEGKPRCEKAKD